MSIEAAAYRDAMILLIEMIRKQPLYFAGPGRKIDNDFAYGCISSIYNACKKLREKEGITEEVRGLPGYEQGECVLPVQGE